MIGCRTLQLKAYRNEYKHITHFGGHHHFIYQLEILKIYANIKFANINSSSNCFWVRTIFFLIIATAKYTGRTFYSLKHCNAKEEIEIFDACIIWTRAACDKKQITLTDDSQTWFRTPQFSNQTRCALRQDSMKICVRNRCM